MMELIEGPALLVGDQIDTDRIIPARFCDAVEPGELGARLFEDLDPGLRDRARGAVLVAGRNFGCGSSRETAPLALLGAGIRGVVAASFSRIFFRNAVNVGLPVVECPEARPADGDPIRLDLPAGLVVLPREDRRYPIQPLAPVVSRILRAGGLVPLIRAELENRA